MAILFYWKKSIFENEIANARSANRFEFYSPFEKFYKADINDNVWIFAKDQGKYVLVAKVVVKEKPPQKRHPCNGNYCIIGDPKNSCFYETDLQKNKFEPVIKSVITLNSGKKWNNEIGVHFRGRNSIRVLDPQMDKRIETFARLYAVNT